MRKAILLSAALAAAATVSLGADVKTTARTQIKFEGMLGRMIGMFGGSKPQTATVAVRGDRKATLADGSGRIIDLGEEKIYDIDAKRKTYTVTTFEQLRREIQEAKEEAAKEAAEAGEQTQSPDEPGGPEYEFDLDVKETGATKSMAGHNARQVLAIVTMRQKGKTLEEAGGLVLTSDMWLAPRIAALDQVYEFDRKFAEKVYGEMGTMSASQLAALLAVHPGFQKAQERLAKEGAKLQGTPLMTTLTLEAVKDPAAAAQNQGGGGGLAGRLMRRNQEKPGTKTKVFASTHETLTIDASASAADVAIPAEFKERK
ncbi:MAG TPA: hypothetical protein VMN81_08550 [Vicinamibacterales bacterium]|nr:hypothetical protein [Vicinamibacterales bacterium]